jgi:Flp pilus assembly protein TadG
VRNVFRKKRRGNVLMMSVLSMGVLAGFASLAVDFGRIQVVKAELQATADAAARAAARELIKAPGQARQAASDVLSANFADGVAVDSGNDNIEFGNWNSETQTFTPAAPGLATAVRVRAQVGRSGNSVPTLWASILGVTSVRPTATAVAATSSDTITLPANTTSVYVPARSNVMSAGKPANASIWDMWGGENLAGGSAWSPSGTFTYGSLAATDSDMDVNGGDKFQFAASGSASWQVWGTDSYAPYRGPDGNPNWSQTVMNHAANFPGISNINSPDSCLIAVFIDDNEPCGDFPPTLDFSSSGARNYTSLSPQLGQVFFVGDGVTSNGQKQTITAPPGAKRLFFGFSDGHVWRDNAGGFSVDTTRVVNGISLVR